MMTDAEWAAGEIKAEHKFQEDIAQAVQATGPYFTSLFRTGSGNGDWMIQCLKDEIAKNIDYNPLSSPTKKYKKKKIPHYLQKKVFERDGYRCKICNSHFELCADHIISEKMGGATVLDNLQTLCNPCNISKGSKSFSVIGSTV
jgi:5-methylcytosine-specific restriction endonuclease McrA